MLLFAAAAAFRYTATFFVSMFLEGFDAADLLLEIGYFFLYTLLDVTQVTVVLLVSHLLLRKKDEQWHIRAKACLAKGVPVPDRLSESVPSDSIFSLKVCISRKASSTIYTLSKIANGKYA